MTSEVDAGDIVAQIALPLTETDDYLTLYRRAMEAVDPLVGEVEEFFISGRRAGIPQEAACATYFHEDEEEDHRVRWRERSPRQIVNLSRTLQAFAFARGKRIVILGAAEAQDAGGSQPARPGRIVSIDDAAVTVAARGGCVAISRLGWRDRTYPAGPLARFLGLKTGQPLG